jgi:hypothetical protein
MSTRDFERRHPRVTVQDLRRDLRHADEQLFSLRAPERPVSPRIWPRRGPIALALAGMVPLAFGAWASLAGEPPRQAAAVRVEVTPIAATVIPDPVRIAPLVAAYQPEPSEQRPQPAPRPATVRRAGVTASQTIATTAAPQKAAWEPPRRHVPRPLSPGEFGRR